MGLDQSFYLIERFDASAYEGKFVEDLPSGIRAYPKSRMDEKYCVFGKSMGFTNMALIRAVVDAGLVTQTRLRETYVDVQKILTDNGVPAGAHITGAMYTSEGTSYSIGDKRIFVSTEDIEKKYLYTKEEEYYIFKVEEVHSERNNYDLQDYFVQTHGVLNTGYCKVDKEDCDAVCDLVHDFRAEYADNLFYWEWY